MKTYTSCGIYVPCIEDVPLVEFIYLVLRMYLWWSLCTLYLHACQVSYHRQLRSLLLYLCYTAQHTHTHTKILCVSKDDIFSSHKQISKHAQEQKIRNTDTLSLTRVTHTIFSDADR